jgi:hypothetical protein
MYDVVMLKLRTVKQVSNNTCICRDLYADGVFDCPHRGQSMGVSSDPAGSLHEVLCISGIPSLKDQFDAPEHLSGAPGIFYLAALNFYFDTKVAFYSCNRVDRYSLSHMFPPFF